MMELLYIGSVCDQEVFNNTVSKSKIKPSASAQNFESALIRGFAQLKDIHLTCISTESIASFPHGSRLILRRRKDIISDSVCTSVIPAINLPGIKNYMHGFFSMQELKKWLKNTEGDERAVLFYGLYPSVVEKCLNTCKEACCKCFCMVTDIPKMMFTNTKSKGIVKKLFARRYKEKALFLQGNFDGYIYLTEAMSEAVAPGKPYIVVETIVDEGLFDAFGDVSKANPPAIMYAGALYKKYGVDSIVETFKLIKSPCELWLYGSGDYESELIKEANENLSIRYFGRVSRNEVLINEKRATLLINLRNSQDDYTKYSFPSKMGEYMLSGTPVFSTHLEGIPDEYYNYIYSTKNNDPSSIATEISHLINDTPSLIAKGEAARNYVRKEKNAYLRSKEISDFIRIVLKNNFK